MLLLRALLSLRLLLLILLLRIQLLLYANVDDGALCNRDIVATDEHHGPLAAI